MIANLMFCVFFAYSKSGIVAPNGWSEVASRPTAAPVCSYAAVGTKPYFTTLVPIATPSTVFFLSSANAAILRVSWFGG